MCKGGGLNNSDFKFSALTPGSGDVLIFDGKNNLFANRYGSYAGSVTLQIVKVKNGGRYLLRFTKTTANTITITLPAAAINIPIATNKIYLQGPINTIYLFEFTWDGTNYLFNSVEYNPPQIRLITAVAVSTLTKVDNYSQHGRNVVIDNEAVPITLSCSIDSEENFVSSYVLHGTGAVTFAAGAGATIVQVNSTLAMNGLPGSTASLSRVGTTFYLRISNRV